MAPVMDPRSHLSVPAAQKDLLKPFLLSFRLWLAFHSPGYGGCFFTLYMSMQLFINSGQTADFCHLGKTYHLGITVWE